MYLYHLDYDKSNSILNWNMKTLNILLYILLILAILGFVDTTYLSAKFFSGAPIACGVIEGCGEVLLSPYSKVFNIPLSVIGAIYYLVAIILIFLYIAKRNKNILLALVMLTALGFLASLYFVYLQLFVIGAICLYCMVSALITTLLLILSGFSYAKEKGESLNASTPLF